MMKKPILICVVFLLIFAMLPGCVNKEKTVQLEFGFELEDIDTIEMYHYDETPASAEKKVITAKEDIKYLYEMFEGLTLQNRVLEGNTSVTDNVSFRFNLSDNTDFEIIYTGYGVKHGMLSSQSGSFELFTAADIGWAWDQLNTDLEAVPADWNELPQ